MYLITIENIHVCSRYSLAILNNSFIDFYAAVESYIVVHTEGALKFAFTSNDDNRHKFHMSQHAQCIPVLFCLQPILVFMYYNDLHRPFGELAGHFFRYSCYQLFSYVFRLA